MARCSMFTPSSCEMATTSQETCRLFRGCGDRSNSNTRGCDRSWSAMRIFAMSPKPHCVQLSGNSGSKPAICNLTPLCRHICSRRHFQTPDQPRSEEHTSELQSHLNLVCL